MQAGLQLLNFRASASHAIATRGAYIILENYAAKQRLNFLWRLNEPVPATDREREDLRGWERSQRTFQC
jgi:hypothetical protein